MNNNIFNAKILLFGEYTVLKGSSCLLVPYPKYQGRLQTTISNIKSCIDLDLLYFIEQSSILSDEIDTTLLRSDIEKGLIFDSSIPIGKGLGSSGALSAALLSKYSQYRRDERYTAKELRWLKDILGLLESYYHGKSSGLDPLLSFIDKCVVVKNNHITTLNSYENSLLFDNLYLYDSLIGRTTGPFVHDFLKDCTRGEYFDQVKNMIDINNEIIDNITKSSKIDYELFQKISELQLTVFEKMIPQKVKALWLKGLMTKKYFFKLCGAGGGGAFLVYTSDTEIIKDLDLIKCFKDSN